MKKIENSFLKNQADGQPWVYPRYPGLSSSSQEYLFSFHAKADFLGVLSEQSVIRDIELCVSKSGVVRQQTGNLYYSFMRTLGTQMYFPWVGLGVGV